MHRVFARTWLPYLLILAATALVWGQTAKFAFVWDDQFFIRDLPSIRSLKNIPGMFYQIEAQALRPHEFLVFRPIRTAVYAVLYFLGGKAQPQAWLYHLTNLIGHGATAMMLFVTARLLLRRLGESLSESEVQAWALGIALAFAVHPVVSEVVCWAKSLDDILAAFFTLAALREVLQPPENGSARWRGILFYALAVYSKESAVPFVLLLPAVWMKIHRLPLRQVVLRGMPFLAVAVIYVLHRHWVLGRTSQIAPISGSYGQTLVDMLPVALTYFRLLCGLPPFCSDYSYLTGGNAMLSAPVLGGLLLLLALAAGGWRAWCGERWRLAGFGLLWTGLFLLPASNLIPMMQYLAERFLYLPLIGWLLAMTGLLVTLRGKQTVLVIWYCTVLAWGILAWNRSWIWQDELTLFVRTSQENPRSLRVEENAVGAVFDLPVMKRVFTQEHGSLALVDPVDTKVTPQVITTLNEARRLFPENRHLLAGLAMILASTGAPEQAVPLFEQVARQAPERAVAWLNLARAARAAGQWAQARSAVETVLKLEPTNHLAFPILFACEWQTGEFSPALETARRWNAIAPDAQSAAAVAQAEAKRRGP